MASQVCETLAFINGDDGVREMEVLEINGALLMSLMEESPSDESDDERLDSLIRSFEAEISGNKMGDHDSVSTGSSQLMSNVEDDAESCNTGHMEGQDYYWASSSDEFGVEWVDMDLMPSSPFDDRSWCSDPYGDEKDGMVDSLKVYDGFDMEEHVYNSFWQDNNCDMRLMC